MDSTKYIGMDVHKETVSIAVMNSAGKVVTESIIETKTATILQFIQGLRGNLHVTFEEGTWAARLSDDQQRSHTGHESAQGSLPGLGHFLRRCDCLRTAPSFGMAGQNNGSRGAPSGRVLLPAARCPAGLAPTSAGRSLGGESKT